LKPTLEMLEQAQ